MCGGAYRPPRPRPPYNPDIVLGKVRHYPPWPGLLVDPFSVPYHIAKRHPCHQKPILKCIQFFPSGDYAWLAEEDLSQLTTSTIESYLANTNNKPGDLVKAYRIALNPSEWKWDRQAMLNKAEDEAVDNAKAFIVSRSEHGQENNNDAGSGIERNLSSSSGKRLKERDWPGKSSRRYNIGDVVLGKVGGYLTWPGWIIHPETAGSISGRQVRGKINYCVQFFPAGDCAWQLEDNIDTLHKDDMEAYIISSRSHYLVDASRLRWKKRHQRMRDFVAGCCTALDPRKWSEERGTRITVREPMSAEVRGKGNADENQKKRKRKSGKSADVTLSCAAPQCSEPVTEVGVMNGDTELSQPLAKKQRNEVQAEVNEGDTTVKNGTAHPERETVEESVEINELSLSTDTTLNTGGRSSKIPSNPEAFDVWFWRHQLQKAFFSDSRPKDEDTPLLAGVFTKLEAFEEMSLVSLRSSKIQKVMRLIAKLPDEKVPKDGEFRFRARAGVLVERWQVLMKDAGAINGEASVVV